MFRKEKVSNLVETKYYPGYNYYDVYRLRLLTEPQKYNFLPNSFIIRVKDPENFIPYKMEKHFNEKAFYSILHRECFNSCVDTDEVEECYSNCRSKHLTALQLFKKSVEESRKWNPITSYVNLKEYQKRPAEMGKNVPSDTDYYVKYEYLRNKLLSKIDFKNKGLNKVFYNATGMSKEGVHNIFNLYLSGKFPPYTQKALERNNIKGRYEEYVKLNELYGQQANDLLNSKEPELTWGHVSGEDYEN
jgi:hypothetical protein